MRKRVFLSIFLVVAAAVFSLSNCWAKVINVPGDESTIQAGIDAASNGDIVEVSPGRYVENINFNGKLITVTSTGGPKVTTIDGGKKDSVVAFSSGETTDAVLSGFTITNGLATGGGIRIN